MSQPTKSIENQTTSKVNQGEKPLVIVSSNPQIVRVTLEAQGTLLYNGERG